MRLFLERVGLSARRQLTYRAAVWAALVTNVFFGLLRAFVMIALYGERDAVNGMTMQDAITYTGLTQAVIGYLSIFGSYQIMNAVYTGEISADLLRPLSYLRLWLALDLGQSLVNLVLRGVTIMLIYAVFVKITVPETALQWLALGAAVALSWLVSFLWRFLVNLAAFWTPRADGIGRFAFGIMWVMSGFYMPLALYPAWFRRLCELTPFPAMVNTPVEVYLGLLDGQTLLLALLQQIAWALGLLLVSQFTLRRGVHRLVIQGG